MLMHDDKYLPDQEGSQPEEGQFSPQKEEAGTQELPKNENKTPFIVHMEEEGISPQIPQREKRPPAGLPSTPQERPAHEMARENTAQISKSTSKPPYMAEADDHNREDSELSHKANKWGKPRSKKTGTVGCFSGIVMTTVIVVAAIMLAAFMVSCLTDLLGFMKSDESVEVTVPEQTDTSEMAEILHEEGLINQPIFFKLFTKVMKKKDNYPAGTYSLKGTMGYEGMIKEIQESKEERETVKLTFPEGWTLNQIADYLERAEVCSRVAFLRELQKSNFSGKYPLVNGCPTSENRFYRLEGYMFPDTYNFYIGDTPEEVIKRFLDNLETQITPEMRKQADAIGMSMDEVLTLASIVQKEASDNENMPKVASVFCNRLNNPGDFPNLQSDVTINYVNDDIIPNLTENTARYNAYYNTYVCKGLPSGAVCSPGLAAINAVLYPADTNYYYFVTDSKGRYYYAVTFDEHKENIRMANEVDSVAGGVDTDQ